MKNRRMRKGFTLVELLVVIAIIGILAAMLLPNAFKTIDKAKIAKAEADLHTIKTAVIVYWTDVGSWPTAIGDLMTAPGGVTGWDGPYLEKTPGNDPWGAPYALIDNSGSTDHSPTGWSGTKYNIYIDTPSVPSTAATKMDKDMDNNDTTTGTMQYLNTNHLYYGVGAK